MSEQIDADRRPGFLSRLRNDQAGNTLAMFAAALFPIAGLIGGGLDMSRVYLVKTRLQAACDSGALAGRKQMGVGTWAANSNKANTEAVRMFNLNFEQNSYATTSATPTFTEASGSVTGTASATVPMTLMRIFGTDDSQVEVTCNAAMSIPNTDIMFVLDTTGSMAKAPDGTNPTASNPSKIDGLRKVTKCFYEALAKIDITTVTPADCNETANPSGGNAAGSQIRFGFVPYSNNVNVGKLLPNDYFVDNYTYQSREAVLTPVWVYSIGAESAISYGSYNNPAAPTAQTSGWTNYTDSSNTSAVQNIGGTNYNTITAATTTGNCPGTTTVPSATGPEVGTATNTLNSANTAAPVHPGGNATTSTYAYGNYTGTLPQTRRFYRYFWGKGSTTTNKCRLQYGTAPYNKTRTGTTTKPITWTLITDAFTNWQYKARSLNVSALKAGGSTWNSSVALPVGYTTETLMASGTTGVSYNRVANLNATWDGCIEERKTLATNSWNPYPSASASPDLDLKSAPTTNDDTKWKPSFNGGIWLQATGYVAGTTELSGKNFGTTTTSADLTPYVYYNCPSPARLLAEYKTATAATDFGDYLDNLVARGGTYHDIGMIWGARLLLKDGIFSANNTAGAATGVDRNIIYMTDGDTDSSETSNTAYGFPWFDRRQNTDPGTGMTEDQYDDVINPRFEAICDQLTNNENVTVWVVSFGGTGISTTTKARLKLCSTNGATDPDNVHYFDASNTAELMTSFKAIASAISQLRLTN